ncbi:MAG: hypothetical protein M1831_007053 [Alyxoria varia]|nr:MAG: hypothetical protein M1831_007053 [Alyxoria varia]
MSQYQPPIKTSGRSVAGKRANMRVAIAGTGGLAYYLAYFIHEETSHQLIWLSRSPKPDLVQQGYQLIVVDYQDRRALEYTLRGVDVVISTIPGDLQVRIVDAAIRAGVRRFAPAEYEGRPGRRPHPDPLDRGKSAVLAHLRHNRNKIESTSFVCGVFYERFAPGGLFALNIGHGSHIADEAAYMVDVRNLQAEVPYSTASGTQVFLCLTAASDVARFIVKALDIGSWPPELIMQGERMSTYELLSTIARARSRSFESQNVVYHNPQSLDNEVQKAHTNGNTLRQRALRELVATQEARYDFMQTNLNAAFPDSDYPQQSKSELVDERKSNLPLPEQPPTASDFSSGNQKTVNVGSGGDNARNDQPSDSAGLGSGPATGVSEARVAGDAYKQNVGGMENVGRQRVEGLDGPPSDAVAGGKANTQAPSDGRTVEEGPGHIPSDSLAAESVRGEGSFAASESRGADVSSVPGRSTTANTTDTSGATVLPPSSDAPSRFTASEKGGEYRTPAQAPTGKEATGEYYSAQGAVRADAGQVGPGDATYDTSSGRQQGSYAGAASSNSSAPSQASYGGAAPATMNPNNHLTSGQARPKGANITEGGFDPADHPNASLAEGGTEAVGGDYDPARRMEGTLEHSNARAGFDAAYPGSGQKGGARGTTDQGGFGNLGEDQA